MTTRLLAPTLLGLLALGIACGGGQGPSPPAGSPPPPDPIRWNAIQHCADIAVMSACFDSERPDLTQDACLLAVSYTAVPTDGPCPSEGRVGSCQTAEGMLHYYAQGERRYDTERAKAGCKDVHAGRYLQR